VAGENGLLRRAAGHLSGAWTLGVQSGVNALRWWQWTHHFDVGRHSAWTMSVQYRSQKLFSRLVQGFYYWIGTALLGMRGDYPEYNPGFEDDLNIVEISYREACR